MKKIVFTSICLLIACITYAQAPKSFNYQAVIRDVNGDVIKNKTVAIQLSILKSSATGVIVYCEKHNLNTNDYGMVNLFVGEGTVVSGLFNNIDWPKGEFFLKIELDINGGTNFIEISTSKLLSVPYALYADKAKIATDDKDMSATNELQELSLNGDTLAITKGNKITIPTNWKSTSTGISYDNGTVQIGQDGKPFSEITEIYDTTASDENSVSFSLPSGFSYTNTRVLSVEILRTVASFPTPGSMIKYNSYAYGLGYVKDGVAISYYLHTSNIFTFPSITKASITVEYPEMLRDKPIRILLMRVN